MGTAAYWLSRMEQVEVEQVVEASTNGRYTSPKYQAKRQDGSRIIIDRSDIILEEEQTLIDELAQILYHNKQPVQHERYSFIMRQFILKGVPYVSKLKTRKPMQQSLDLFHAG